MLKHGMQWWAIPLSACLAEQQLFHILAGVTRPRLHFSGLISWHRLLKHGTDLSKHRGFQLVTGEPVLAALAASTANPQ